MWNPIKIEMKNVFSHVDSQYTFNNGKCTMIFGENRTDKSFENNGAGKTTLFEAICIALTGDSLRNIRKEQFINNFAESAEIQFTLENKVLYKTMTINRKFYRNKSAQVFVFENGELNTQITSVNEANSYIAEQIGVSHEDLLRYYIISQDSNYTFFTAGDGEKKEILNRITQADLLNPVLERIDAEKREVEGMYNSVSLNCERIDAKIETLQEQKREMQQNDDYEEEIRSFKDKVESQRKIILKSKESVSELRKDIDELTKQLKTKKCVDLTQLREERNKVRKQLEDVESTRSENVRMRRKIESELAGTVKCPECGTEFIEESELDLTPDKARKLIKQLDTTIKCNEKEKEDLLKKIDDLRISLQKAQDTNDEIDKIKSNIKIQERAIECENENVRNAEKVVDFTERKIRELQEEHSKDTRIKTIEQKIRELTTERQQQGKNLKLVEERLEMCKFWKFNMGKSGFATYLANKSVKVIEGITNAFLRKFGVDVSVQINGFTLLKSGDVREKIDCYVTNDGITLESFMAKSGGERGRVTLAGVLGIQRLLNESTDGRGLNLLCFDEAFKGMDTLGQENIIRIMERMGMTILVISQNVSDGFNNENTLRVVKEEGVSRYV